jgi:hypothetical protein
VNIRQEEKIASLAKANGLLNELPNRGPQVDMLTVELGQTLTRILNISTAQARANDARTGHADALEVAREKLRRGHMFPIARRGKRLLTWVPDVEKALRLPPGNLSHKQLLGAAETMASALTGKPAEFLIAEGHFPTDFLETLRAAAKDVEVLVAASIAVPTRRRNATSELAREVRHGRETLDDLEGLLMPRMRVEPGLAKRWREARRLQKKTGRPRTRNKRLSEPGKTIIILTQLKKVVRREVKRSARGATIKKLIRLRREKEVEGYELWVVDSEGIRHILQLGPDGTPKPEGAP